MRAIHDDVEKRPNVFLVGAPRCGTTALARFLGQHPDLFVPYVKEPHFFGSDLTAVRGFPTLDSYLELYVGAQGRSAVDASTWYLYSENAAEEIASFQPTAKIIVMVRDPVELVHSWHSLQVLQGAEPIEAFEDAIAAESERRRGVGLPRNAAVERFMYSTIPRFATQILRYVNVFGRDHVKVVVYDDFRSDNVATVQDVYEYLGVDRSFAPEVAIVNAEARPRSRWMQRFIENQPPPARALVRAMLPRRVRHHVRQALRQVNTAPRQRPTMSPAIEGELRRAFSSEVDALGRLIGRDLSDWSDVRRRER